MHLDYACGQYFAYTFVHEEALCKMDAAIAHNRPKTHSCDHFGAKFDLFKPHSKIAFALILMMDKAWIHHYNPESREG